MSQNAITREQAAAIAAQNLRWRKDVRGYQIRSVLRIEEIKGPQPNPYLPSSQDLHDAWIVYLHDPNCIGLCSSTIMVISRDTGHVSYLGSACDEG
jgi:hypothetical protein